MWVCFFLRDALDSPMGFVRMVPMMNETNETPRFPIQVLISEIVPAFAPYRGAYEIQVLSWGSKDIDDAFARAEATIARCNARQHVIGPGKTETHEHRATFRRGCDHCRVTGKEPGYKRKKCTACNGEGTFALEGLTASFAAHMASKKTAA